MVLVGEALQLLQCQGMVGEQVGEHLAAALERILNAPWACKGHRVPEQKVMEIEYDGQAVTEPFRCGHSRSIRDPRKHVANRWHQRPDVVSDQQDGRDRHRNG